MPHQNWKSALLSRPVRKTLDLLLAPFTLLAAIWFRYFRSRDITEMKATVKILDTIGVFPIGDHYYEPLAAPAKHIKPLGRPRHLPALRLNLAKQIEFLSELRFGAELQNLPLTSSDPQQYCFQNLSFGAGDGEILYAMVRSFKPRRIIEVGAGYSTLMIREALRRNDSDCRHICVEPYEVPWLEQVGVEVARKRVQDLPVSLFQELKADDILFIDSSHMIRPQGDVLFEILEVLPSLKPGVLVHFHDIFTPRDYPDAWVFDLRRFWNEQYLLEAYLSENPRYEVLLATNQLFYDAREPFLEACPVLRQHPDCACLGSLWLRRVG